MVRTVFAWAGVSGTFTGTAAAVGGPDYAGIALVISAIAAVIGALTGFVSAIRRKPEPPSAQVDALAAVLTDIRDRLNEDDK